MGISHGCLVQPPRPAQSRASARRTPHLPVVREAPEPWALGLEGLCPEAAGPARAVSRPQWLDPPVGKQMLSLLSFAAQAAPGARGVGVGWGGGRP